MKKEKAADTPVMWESSVLSPRTTVTPKAKTRLFTSQSSRFIPLPVEQYPVLDYLYSPISLPKKCQPLRKDLTYTLHYIGVCNGEMGILSQRKPIPVPLKSSPKHISTDTISLGNEANSLPQEYLRPSPHLYNEFLVHTFTKPHLLTPVSSPRDVKSGRQDVVVRGNYRNLHDIKPAVVGRKGISGWKLTTSRGNLPKKHDKNANTTPYFPLDMQKISFRKGTRQRNEAYLEQLRAKGVLKDQ